MSDNIISHLSLADVSAQVSGSTIGNVITPFQEVGTLRVTVELGSSGTFGFIMTPSGGSPMAASLLNGGASLLANVIYAFTFALKGGAEYDFQHFVGAPADVKQLLVEEVRGGIS